MRCAPAPVPEARRTVPASTLALTACADVPIMLLPVRECSAELQWEDAMKHIPQVIGLTLVSLIPGLAIGISTPPATAAECPTSSFQVDAPYPYACDVQTNEATFDTTCGSTFTRGRGHFDLVQRTIGLSLLAGAMEGGTVTLDVAERFLPIGPPPGTPITCTLRMPVSASVSAYGDIDTPASAKGSAQLEVDGAVVAQASEHRLCYASDCTITGNLTTTLSTTLEITSGQAFLVLATVSANGGGYNPGSARVTIDAGLQFDGLPVGVAIVSCHEGATPTRNATWGSIKALYR